MKCEHCNKELKPAPAKLRADGEQTYCGFIPCACTRPIATDYGLAYPGSEEHKTLIESGKFQVTDIR